MAISRAKSSRRGTPIPPPVVPSDAQKQIFLEAYAVQFCITEARKAARWTRAQYLELIEKDPVFLAAMKEVTEENMDRVEAAGFRRAVGGDKDLIKFYLEKKRARDYGPKPSVTVSLTPEQLATMSDEEVADLYAKLSGKK